MRALILTLALALSGCAVAPTAPVPVPETRTAPSAVPAPRMNPDVAARNFVNVVQRVEPVAEDICRAETRGVNCDFAVVVDDRQGLPPNAFQTIGPTGRPIIGFTLSLIAEARNADELAFVLGHEAAHHIAGHLDRQRQSALTGAMLAGALATLGGADVATVENAQSFGAEVGARRYSKGFELEADRLGTAIAAYAGYDPLRGAEYFTRSPDPGNVFLGTHPPNADRIATVRAAAARL